MKNIIPKYLTGLKHRKENSMTTDKVQKIREEVERLKSQLLRGACSSQIAMETRCKEEAYDEVLALLDSIQEELVSEEFEEQVKALWKEVNTGHTYSIIGSYNIFYGVCLDIANWQKQQDQSTIELAEDHAMLAGMEKMREEMMSKAIDTTIKQGCTEVGIVIKGLDKTKFSFGDKVKVIVIKED